MSARGVTRGFLISNFRRVVNAVCFLLGNSPASVFCIPTFRNTLFHLHRQDLKSLIAYSSVAHMSMVIGGIITLSYWGVCRSFALMVE
jgi:NADH:ubiquinone oxidoreductase subunit 4 (subunit M)